MNLHCTHRCARAQRQGRCTPPTKK